MRALNLTLRFLIELACLAALAYWGAGATGDVLANLALAILVPTAAAVAWGVWSAPRASRRLSGRRRAALELALLACSCVLLALAAEPPAGALLALLAILNATWLRQLEPSTADRQQAG